LNLTEPLLAALASRFFRAGFGSYTTLFSIFVFLAFVSKLLLNASSFSSNLYTFDCDNFGAA